MKLTTFVGVALLLGAGYAAAADDPDQTTGMQSTDAQPSIIDESSNASTSKSTLEFKSLDSNQDGYLSRSESQQAGPMDFDAADQNSDGRIDQDEYSAAYQRGLTAQSSANMDEPNSQVGSANTQSQQSTSRMP
jgi:EF hand